MFRPFVGEVLTGKLKKCDKSGLYSMSSKPLAPRRVPERCHEIQSRLRFGLIVGFLFQMSVWMGLQNFSSGNTEQEYIVKERNHDSDSCNLTFGRVVLSRFVLCFFVI